MHNFLCALVSLLLRPLLPLPLCPLPLFLQLQPYHQPRRYVMCFYFCHDIIHLPPTYLRLCAMFFSIIQHRPKTTRGKRSAQIAWTIGARWSYCHASTFVGAPSAHKTNQFVFIVARPSKTKLRSCGSNKVRLGFILSFLCIHFCFLLPLSSHAIPL